MFLPLRHRDHRVPETDRTDDMTSVLRCFGFLRVLGVLVVQIFLCVLLSLCVLSSIRAADIPSPVGLWKNEDATFEIFENQGKLSGKIVAMREPQTADGKEKTDIHNPDASKRERPIIGLEFMSGFTKKTDTRWEEGTIYDPKTGNTYSSLLELDGAETIKVRGYIGISLIGRTAVWTRAQSP
jgi:uncharacterized protein (DUF2147 family)